MFTCHAFSVSHAHVSGTARNANSRNAERVERSDVQNTPKNILKIQNKIVFSKYFSK